MSRHTTAPRTNAPVRRPSPHGNEDGAPTDALKLPGYETLAFVGHGGFSEIWKIRNRQSGQLFALKRPHSDWHNDPAVQQLFSTEARVGQAVDSLHVVRVVETVATAGVEALILEWLDGHTLEHKLAEEGRLPAGMAVWIVRQCVQGLVDLEQTGFRHGDVKPANIYVTSSGLVKLIDLGFAQSLGGKHQLRNRDQVMGTAEYMAPESLSRGLWNPVLSDVYSLGITLFQMLTGRLPFQSHASHEVLQQQRRSRPPLLRRWCPEAPRELAGLVRRLLAKQPIRRPQSLHSLNRELMQLELTTLTDRLVAS